MHLLSLLDCLFVCCVGQGEYSPDGPEQDQCPVRTLWQDQAQDLQAVSPPATPRHHEPLQQR